MALNSKVSWKLQEFQAHNANVNCLALGHKSGRVLATGGDDKKVNLWAVGKHNCIMSLSGHSTPIECVRFNCSEELVCAGSQTGTLKIWDLEAAKLVRTLTGHKSGISCLDFHPYSDFLASGSHDSSLKLWDIRHRCSSIAFKGHSSKVTSIKFSPDGQWIASSGEDTLVKVWDLRANRLLHEFVNHSNTVTSVEFHPHEFLLASGGLDRTVNYWDLENFQLVSTEKDVGAVKCLWFNPDGECLFTGVTDGLKVQGWEPARVFDSVPIGWGKVYDIATAHHQLVGASFHMLSVSIYIVDLKKVKPFGGPPLDAPSSPFSHGQSIRKSFSKDKPFGLKKKAIDVKTIEESTSGTDVEEDFSADITNLKDYTEVFKPNRSLRRTPPLVEPFQAPESDADPTEPQILSHNENDFSTTYTLSQLTLDVSSSPPISQAIPSIGYSSPTNTIPSPSSPPPPHSSPELLNSPPRSLNSEPDVHIISSTPYSRSQSNLEHVFKTRKLKIDRYEAPEQNPLQRQYSCKDVPEKLPSSSNSSSNNNNNISIKHSASEVNLNNHSKPSRVPYRKNSFSKSSRNSTNFSSRGIVELVVKKTESLRKNDEQIFRKPDPPILNDQYVTKRSIPVDIYVSPTKQLQRLKSSSPETDKSTYVPTPMDKPIGLDLEEFLPENLRSVNNYNNHVNELSEDELLETTLKDHNSAMAVLVSRNRSLQMAHQHFRNTGDLKTALERIMNLKDNAVIHDILRMLIHRSSFWSLDVCVLILPKVHELIQNRIGFHIRTGCEVVHLTLKNFSSIIRSNMKYPCTGYSVDIPREERYQKCRKCYEALMDIRTTVASKQTLLPSGSDLTTLVKDVHTELCRLCIDEQQH